MNINIKTFDKWAKKGKDVSMAEGHAPAVNQMTDMIFNTMSKKFNMLDIGCGNGWVVRAFKNHSLCYHAAGIDGAKQMIDNAIKIDPKGEYILSEIESWNNIDTYDVIFSMETFYYFDNPELLIKKIYQSFLKNNGMLIIGIDHYLENKSTLDWDSKFNIKTNTLSKESWIDFFHKAGFKDCRMVQVCKKENWEGTLVISGRK
tara:strand:- start:470 stop:1078 length:609 start_codon:yes stop_codon:yes gene_type:complete